MLGCLFWQPWPCRVLLVLTLIQKIKMWGEVSAVWGQGPSDEASSDPRVLGEDSLHKGNLLKQVLKFLCIKVSYISSPFFIFCTKLINNDFLTSTSLTGKYLKPASLLLSFLFFYVFSSSVELEKHTLLGGDRSNIQTVYSLLVFFKLRISSFQYF